MSFIWGAVCRPKQGQRVSGDVYVVLEHSGGQLLAAIIDGLGGGEEAAHAANLGAQVLHEHADWGLQDLTRAMHTAMHHTRGAVSGLLRLDPVSSSARFVGVGNIGVHAYSRQPIKPISKSGILGFRLPTLLELSYSYQPGDLFVLYSDGISSRFAQEQQADLKPPPQQIADYLLTQYGKSIDDATVVVVKT